MRGDSLQKNKGGGKYFVAPLYDTSMTVLGKESFLAFFADFTVKYRRKIYAI